MKCIYCNSETNLTSSDIITCAITGAKLTKLFVCKTHNQFTNNNYEKKFAADLSFLRNQLGLTTREGNPIQYTADVSIDGLKMHNVKMSNRESFYAPKDVVAGFDDNGNKILMAPMKKLEKKSNGKATAVDTSEVIIYKNIEADSFLGFHAIHSMAKMAYEWYCYINKIEEYKEEYNEIVEYILCKKDGDFVDIIFDRKYDFAIDQLSEIGTNSFFQYDDNDGYRYVVIDFWKTIAYRVRICKSPNVSSHNERFLIIDLYLYQVDGSKTQAAFIAPSSDNNKKRFITIEPQKVTVDIWRCFIKRIERIMSTRVISIYFLKREVDKLSYKLKRYDAGKMDAARLLEFEEDNVIATIDIINQLYIHKDKYDTTKLFNHNLPIILNLDGDTITRTQNDKKQYLKILSKMDEENTLSEYIWNGINAFYEIYENEMNLTK